MKIKEGFVAVTLSIKGCDRLLDYPKNLPLPRVGDTIIYGDFDGTVIEVKHMIFDTVAEIKIIAR